MPNIIVGHLGWPTPKILAKKTKAVRITHPRLLSRIAGHLKVVNWGRSDIYVPPGTACLNTPESVRIASNKLLTLRKLSEHKIPTVEWTDDIDRAKKWVSENKTVFIRNRLEGFGGDGITLVGARFPNSLLTRASLYTKFWKADYEIRVHVFRGRVIDLQRKRKVLDAARLAGLPLDDRNRAYWIRSHRTGWIFSREVAKLSPELEGLAISAVGCLGLSFGAVDIRVRNNRGVVVEINSAPGLAGSTMNTYVTKISEFFKE